MKKVLSLVLAFAMILGSFGFVFASDFSDVKDTEYYSEPVNVLSGLGVIAGFPDGTFKPGDNVTRAQMATMITAALGIPVKGSGATGFSDVPASHWASGYIAYAVSVGFVAGYPDKTFKPENPVSYNEALTMIVASLGYTAETLPGVWPGAFVNKARGLGILDICATTGNAAAPRQDIACFLYKALTANIGYVDKDGYWHANLDGNGNANDTMLSRLGAHAKVDKDGKDIFAVITGQEDSAINLQNYLGAYASVYLNKDNEIIAMKEIKSEFIEGKLNSAKTKIGDYKITDKTEQVDDFIGFTNGDENSKIKDYKVAGTNLKLAVELSGSTIKKVYSVQVWNGETFRAGEDIQDSITDDQKLDKYDFATNDDDEINTATFALVGKDSIKDIKEDDVVTVYLRVKADKNGAYEVGDIAKIEVSSKTVEGEVTKISKDGEYTIGGTAYDMAEDATDKAKGVKVETEGTFYLNYAGEIFDFEETEEGTSNYAIVLAAGEDKGRYGAETLYVKLFIADGTTKEFEVKEAKGFTKEDADGKIVWDTKPASGTLVEYTVNSKDKVTELVKASEVSGTKFDKNGIIGKGIALKSNAIVFSFSGDDKTKDDADKYEVLKAADLYDSEVKTVVACSEKDSKKLDAVLVTGVSSANKEVALFVSDDATVADGEVWTALYEGKVAELTLDKSLKDEKAPAAYTSSKAIFYTLTTDSSDVVTAVTEAKDGEVIKVAKADVTDKTSVSGSVFTDAAKTNYSLDADVVVYVLDDDDWSVGKNSAMAGRKNAFESITLVDTDKDGDYDIVLVVKK